MSLLSRKEEKGVEQGQRAPKGRGSYFKRDEDSLKSLLGVKWTSEGLSPSLPPRGVIATSDFGVFHVSLLLLCLYVC